jgi:NAD-dependent SIR2 family protein deacetylase
MTKFDLSHDQKLPPSKCCECGHRMDGVSGPRAPMNGDMTLCIYCGSLNIFDSELLLRPPTDEEIFEAAKSSEVQRAREVICSMRGIKPTADRKMTKVSVARSTYDK